MLDLYLKGNFLGREKGEKKGEWKQKFSLMASRYMSTDCKASTKGNHCLQPNGGFPFLPFCGNTTVCNLILSFHLRVSNI